MKSVAVFRWQLFKPSEGFIASQVSAMTKFKPIFLGGKLFGNVVNHDVFNILTSKSRIVNLFTYLKLVVFENVAPFLKLIRYKEISLIHAHFAMDAVIAMPLVKKIKVPFVTTLHGMDVTVSDRNFILSARPNLIKYVLLRNKLFKTVDAFICVSEFIKKKAIERGFPASKLIVHYIGINTDLLTPRTGPGENNLIVHVARLVEKKGTIYLIKALALVKQSIPDVKLMIIGDGPLRAELEKEAAHLGLAGNIHFLGVQPNNVTVDWVRKSSLLAVPSVTASNGDCEGLPTVIAEAGAQCVPVVAFNSAGIGEIITHGKTGLLSEERDVEGLRDNLLSLLNDPVFREEIGTNARSNIEINFNLKKQSAKLENIYMDLIQAKG